MPNLQCVYSEKILAIGSLVEGAPCKDEAESELALLDFSNLCKGKYRDFH